MAGNFDGIKTRRFGIEIEMTGLTRCEAARALQSVLGGELTHVGGFYDKYCVTDAKRRSWSIVSDSSIIPMRRNGVVADYTYQVEMNSPVLDYEDIPLLYEQSVDPPDIHYNSTRYFMLNLHSFFQNGHYEIRAANASLHAGEVRSQIVLALAINNAAMTKKYCSPAVSHSDNMRYSFRVWLLHLGLIGEEFKNCRAHLLKHLTGNCAWRHPEDAIAQRERLKEQRRAAREQRECAVSGGQGSAVETAPADCEAAVDDFEENAETVRMYL